MRGSPARRGGFGLYININPVGDVQVDASFTKNFNYQQISMVYVNAN
ncbi:MAG TPA: hypothetical protein PKN86_10340 [Candidatus Obscuribacter sp.]|nr:hypothetical protein [Candidatus Obscuribacter sp.]HMY56106.1 hypothetical protein [Candidatus Obscuribacter sp.]HND66936.1 hypothetical protein [Candidatus Obscuribacter sp.]HNG20972.1 hypothetical protein [Candidatus Obscuribacter sp.]HNM50094.1 hypothetical protein [Candidatus Obscuribacter sp.]